MDYLRIVNTYTFATLYGSIFSQCYLSCWFISMIEFYVIRKRLLFESKRPVPKGCRSIGLWIQMIKVISWIGVITNAFFMSFVVFKTD